MKIVQNHKSGKLRIGQPAYTESVLQKFDMMNANEISTPVHPGTKLVNVTEESDVIDQRLYQSAVGSPHYLDLDLISHILLVMLQSFVLTLENSTGLV